MPHTVTVLDWVGANPAIPSFASLDLAFGYYQMSLVVLAHITSISKPTPNLLLLVQISLASSLEGSNQLHIYIYICVHLSLGFPLLDTPNYHLQ